MSELENTYYILSKTHQSSTCILQKDECDNSDDLNLMLSTIQLPKSFYNKSERKASKIIYNQEYLAYDETTYGNTITMDITSNIFFITISVKILCFYYFSRYFR